MTPPRRPGGHQAGHRRPHPGEETGGLPQFTHETGYGLRQLSARDEAIRGVGLRGRYYIRQNVLHGECFYIGLCDPLDETKGLVRETSGYIEVAEGLARTS